MRNRGFLDVLLSLARGPVTVPYPHVREQPMPGARGSVGFVAERCTACRRCVAACPTGCLFIDGDEQPVPPAPLRDMWLDRGACITCSACIDVCPTGALVWRPEDELATNSRGALVARQEDLRPLSAPAPAPAPQKREP